MKNKLYKKIVRWKKKPNYDKIIGGLILTLVALGMGICLGFEDKSVTILTAIFTFMFIFGIKRTIKNFGKGKNSYFQRVGAKR